MESVNIKSGLHKLIDNIQNVELLESLYEILSSRSESSHKSIWTTMTAQQKQEVLDAYKESEDPNNLISHEQVLRDLK